MKQADKIISTKYKDVEILDDRIILGGKAIPFEEIINFRLYSLKRFNFKIIYFFFPLIISYTLWKNTNINQNAILGFGSLTTLALIFLHDFEFKNCISINKRDGTFDLIHLSWGQTSWECLKEFSEKHLDYKLKIIDVWSKKELEKITNELGKIENKYAFLKQNNNINQLNAKVKVFSNKTLLEKFDLKKLKKIEERKDLFKLNNILDEQ